MFTVGMYCTRMMARSIRVGLVIDCTALDLEDFEPLPVPKSNNAAATSLRASAAAARRNGGNSNNNNASKDRRVRYFHNPSEWDDYDVEYHRMLPPPTSNNDNNNSASATTGEDNEPLAPKVLNEFFRVVSNFQKSINSNKDDTNTTTHIALFDSRGGLGAAAYLAAAYMCLKLKAPVHAAIEAIKEGTPPQPSPDNDPNVKWGLCDVRLMKDLQSRFKGRKEIVMEGRVPSWWWALDDEEDDDDEEEEEGNGESASTNGKKRKREESIIIPPHETTKPAATNGTKRSRDDSSASNNTTLHPRLPTEALEPVPTDSPKYTRAITVLGQLTQATPQATEPLLKVLPLKPELDVSNNCADDNASVQSIKSNPNGYKVTWLSNGRRGLLLILSEAVFFIEQHDQLVQVSQVTSMKFPTPQDSKKSQHRTLLDVTLVADIEKGGPPTYRFYVLDILCIEGGRVWHKSWEQRWKFLNEGVVLPRKKEEAKQQQLQHQNQQQHGHVYAKEPIKLRAKEYFPMKKLAFVMKDVCAGVAHEANGVRVVPMGEYRVGDSEDDSSVMAVVWRRGGDVQEENLVSLLS